MARSQGRFRHQRVLVVHEDEVLGGAEDRGRVEADRLVELKGVRGAPEGRVGQQELVDRREHLDRGLEVERVRPAIRHRVDVEWTVRDPVEVRPRGALDPGAPLTDLAAEPDDEVEEVQVVSHEQVVLQGGERPRPERVEREVRRGDVARDEVEDLGPDVEMAQDEEVRAWADEPGETPPHHLVEDTRRRQTPRCHGLDRLDRHHEEPGNGPHQRQDELATGGLDVQQPQALGLVAERRALVQVKRHPRVGIVRIVGPTVEGVEALHRTSSIWRT